MKVTKDALGKECESVLHEQIWESSVPVHVAVCKAANEAADKPVSCCYLEWNYLLFFPSHMDPQSQAFLLVGADIQALRRTAPQSGVQRR